MDPAVITLMVLAAAAFLFVTELIPLCATALAAPMVLGICGVLSPEQVFSGLSNPTVVMFAGMFVVGAAILESGLALAIGNLVVQKAGTRERPLTAALMGVTIAISSVCANTSVVACLMPVFIGIAAAAKIPVSPLLMALVIAAAAGGTITMAGCEPNMLTAAAMENAGIEPFGFLEFAWVGIPLSLLSVWYMLFIGLRLTPRHPAASGMTAPKQRRAGSRAQSISCFFILLYAVFGLSIGIPGMTYEMAAVSAAMACVLSGCISERTALLRIDWVTIFLFAGMLPVAEALDKTGAGRLIALKVVALTGQHPAPLFLTTMFFALSGAITQVMSNTATTALLCPISIAVAREMGGSPYPLLMAVCIASSCAFTTPVGTPPNTMVMGPGGFKFKDYLRAGTPLLLLSLILCAAIIPLVWPFYPA